MFDWNLKQEISTLAAIRARNGIHAGSKLRILLADADAYVAVVDDKVMVKIGTRYDRAEVPDLSVSGDKFDLAEDDPHDPTTTSEPEAPMQSLNQLPVVTDLVGARSA